MISDITDSEAREKDGVTGLSVSGRSLVVVRCNESAVYIYELV